MVGSELLRGVYADTNGCFLARSFAAEGIAVTRTTVVRDVEDEIAEVISRALSRVSLVVVCGGLGPTIDDLTREAIVQATGIPLALHQEIVDAIRQRFASRGLTVSENNLRQAYVPECGGFFPNPNGTAPGLYFESGSSLIVALPGPPRELIPMFHDTLLPFLRQRGFVGAAMPSRLFRLAGIPESLADQRLQPLIANDPGLRVSILARPNLVDITLFHEDAKRLGEIGDAVDAEFGMAIYTHEQESLEQVIGDRCRERGLTLGLAESCTGGLIGGAITNVPGSSAYLVGGIVCYSNKIKSGLLSVSEQTLADHGAVSEETAKALSEGVRKTLGCDIGLSVTGIAGPDGATPEKPLGLVFMACSSKTSTRVERHQFIGTRETIRAWATQRALDLLRRFLCQAAPSDQF